MERRDTMSGAPMEIGMNLDQVNDYTPNWMFTDAFQHSRSWISHSFNTVTQQVDFNGGVFVPVSTDDNGWPTELATWTNAHGHALQQRLGTVMFRELDGRYPAGTYRAEWEGTGDLQFGFDARETSRGRTPEGRNFALLSVTPGNGGIYLVINSMDRADPIRDVHVWMPAYDGQSFDGQRWQPGDDFSPFHPLYKERLADFGILRFMQAQETNTSDIRTWDDRRDAQDARQASGSGAPMANGISVEYMVQLANELDADPWFNMPHMADDDFVRNFATYVRDNLEPERTAYVEWSNEVWNWAPGFEAYSWIAEQIRRPENSGLTHWQFVGREASRDMDIWSDVFAEQADRIVRTVGGQAANAWVTERIVENMGDSFDAIAIAPYFGPSEAQRATYSAATSVDQVLADLRGNLALGAQMTVNHQRLADDFSTRLGRDIQLLAYEGGQHLNGRGASYQDVFYQATKDPRMADLTRDYLRIQNAAGVDAYVHYKLSDRDRASQFGLFGVLMSQDQPLAEAHVYRALQDAAAGTLFTETPTLVTLNTADPIAHEAGLGTASFRVTRGGALSQPLTVNYSVAGDALVGIDYRPLEGSVTIPAGESTSLIVVTPLDDSSVESNETVNLTLLPGTGYSLISTATASARVTIANDDFSPNAPTIRIVASDPEASETDCDPGVFTLTRTGSTAAALTVYLQNGQQTAAASDYDRIPSSVTFAPGEASVEITVRPVDDASVENSESVIVVLNPTPLYRVDVNGSATVMIASDDVAAPAVTPRVSIVATDASAAEIGNDNGLFTLTRTGDLNRALVARYTAVGTATGGRDYAALSGFAYFAWGQATTTIVIHPYNDPTVEPVESVTVLVTDTADYDLDSVSSAVVNISSEDGAPALPTVTIVVTDADASETNRDTGSFTVTRTGETGTALVVNFIVGGTAESDVDYDAIGSSITIPAGQSSANILLRPVNDTIMDANESVTITLAPSPTYSTGSATSTTSGTIVITDDDVTILPVLIVIANNDFYYTEYSAPRAALEAAGIPVVVGAGRRTWSVPHAGTGYASGNGAVMPDIALADARAEDYSAILFVGGWGATQYQYAFPGTYAHGPYNGTTSIRAAANRLINEFTAQGKLVTGVCHGVSVLAWARVNGESPLRSRTVSTAQFNSPANNVPGATLYRWHSEVNGATVHTGGVLGDVTTRNDDVVVDGNIITGENFDSARLLGQTIAERLRNGPTATATVVATDAIAVEAGNQTGQFEVTRTGSTAAALVVNYAVGGAATNGADFETLSGQVLIQPGQSSAAITVRPAADGVPEYDELVLVTVAENSGYRVGRDDSATVTISDTAVRNPQPVLIVIANRDFHYQEYADTRAQLEAAGIPVVVAAARRELATPHLNSGQGSSSGQVMPDIALGESRASDYSAVVFVGGWGASAYQYGFSGAYGNSPYNGSVESRLHVNQLINDFVTQGKYVTALCHGVSVLAWARVNGVSLLRGRNVSAYGGMSPPSNVSDAQLSRWHADVNGATVFTNGQIGDRSTASDDVIEDRRVITAEDYHSARQFGLMLAERVRGSSR